MNASTLSPILTVNRRPESIELQSLRRLAAAVLIRSAQDLTCHGVERDKSQAWFFSEEYDADFKMWCLLARISPWRARKCAEQLLNNGKRCPTVKGLYLHGRTWWVAVYTNRTCYKVRIGRDLDPEIAKEIGAQKREEIMRQVRESLAQPPETPYQPEEFTNYATA